MVGVLQTMFVENAIRLGCRGELCYREGGEDGKEDIFFLIFLNSAQVSLKPYKGYYANCNFDSCAI